jgi:hypothetical protein
VRPRRVKRRSNGWQVDESRSEMASRTFPSMLRTSFQSAGAGPTLPSVPAPVRRTRGATRQRRCQGEARHHGVQSIHSPPGEREDHKLRSHYAGAKTFRISAFCSADAPKQSSNREASPKWLTPAPGRPRPPGTALPPGALQQLNRRCWSANRWERRGPTSFPLWRLALAVSAHKNLGRH